MGIKPMLLNEDSIDISVLSDKDKLAEHVNKNYSGWVFQIKENGVRAVISVKDKKITAIRDRRDTPILHNYPELKDIEIPVDEGLFDAEIVMLNENGKSHFYNEYDENKNITQAGIQLRSMSLKDKETIEKYPVNIRIFDVLKINGKTMLMEPYEDRMEALERIGNGTRWNIVKNWENFELIWEKVKNEDLEGCVAKNPKGIYELDTRSKNNIKIKNYKTVDIEIMDTEKNNKGVRVSGKDENGLEVNFQVFGIDDINKGTIMKIKYLEKIGGFGGRYTQTTVC